MRKKKTKKEFEHQLLETIYQLEHEWKQVQSIVRKSIEPSIQGRLQELIAESKYMYLLREARHRNLRAKR